MKAPNQSKPAAEGHKSPTRHPFLQRKPGAAERPFITNPSAPQIQPKLAVNQPGDRYEQEADSMAERVMRMPSENAAPPMISRMRAGVPVQRKCSVCEQEDKEKQMVQRQAANSDPTHAPDTLAQRLQARRGQGAPLSPTIHQQMGGVFGQDFSGVRLHTDAEAVQMSRDLNAQAFTYGQDIYFDSGKYQPDTASGRGLLGHELTHTVQHTSTPTLQRQASKGNQNTNIPNPNEVILPLLGSTSKFIPTYRYLWQNPQLREDIFIHDFDKKIIDGQLDIQKDSRYYALRDFLIYAREKINILKGEDEEIKKLKQINLSDVIADSDPKSEKHQTIWQIDHDNLMWKIKEVFDADKSQKVFPDFIRVLVVHLSGMRYRSAYHSYYDPREFLKELKASQLQGRDNILSVEKQKELSQYLERLKGMDDYDVLGILIHIKDQLPEWVWGEIVKSTQLKLNPLFTKKGWEKSMPSNGKQNDPWNMILIKWRNKKVGDKWLGKGHQWRERKLLSIDPEFVATSVVCNEIGEHFQRLRGHRKIGVGITSKIKWYNSDTSGVDWASTRTNLKRNMKLEPGTSIFFMGFQTSKDNGVYYSLGNSDLENLSLNKQELEETKPSNREGLISYTNSGVEIQLPDGEHFIYTRRIGNIVYRLGPDNTIISLEQSGHKLIVKWLRWYHEATVVDVIGTKVYTFETGFNKSNGAGLKTRSIGDMQGKWNIFFAYYRPSEEQIKEAENANRNLLEGVWKEDIINLSPIVINI